MATSPHLFSNGVGEFDSIVRQQLDDNFAGLSFNIKSVFGAKGDGVTDDTKAIDTALATLNTVAYNWVLPDYLKVASPELFFPAGDYIYNGTGFNAVTMYVNIRGESRDTTRIQLPPGVVLCTGQTAMFGQITNLHSVGGSGLYNLLSTGSNVEGYFRFENLYCFNYTGCAIGHCFNNAPDWFYKNILFHGALTAGGERQSVGCVIGGLSDGTNIRECDFQENKIAIKCNGGGQYGINNTWIEHNQFYNWTSSPGNLPSYAIWVVPDPSAPTVGNTGVGLRINSNKFGNENIIANDYRIICADETGGTNRLNSLPNIAAISTGFVGGVQVKDNTVYGVSGGHALVYSMTGNLWQWDIDNLFSGSEISSLDYYVGALSNANASSNANNYVRHRSLATLGTGTAPANPSPSLTSHVTDTLSVVQGYDSVRNSYPTGSDPSYLELTTSIISAWSTGSASILGITDGVGGNEAVEITLSANGGGVYLTPFTAVTPGRPCWLSFDCKASVTNPLSRFEVFISDSTGTKIAVVRTFNLPVGKWRRITVPFNVPASDYVINLIEFTNFPGDYSAGSNRFQIGRVRIYHAYESVNPCGRFLDSGSVPWIPGAIGSNTTVSLNVNVVGARSNDIVTWGYDNNLNGVNQLPGQVTSNDTATVYLRNFTGGSLTPTAGNVRVRILKGI